IVELIDRAMRKHGKKIKFLTFKEAQERIDKNLLAGNPLRNAKGEDNGVRLLDLDNDGYLDIVIKNDKTQKTRLWLPAKSAWQDSDLPAQIATPDGVMFGIVRPSKHASMISCATEKFPNDYIEFWTFDGERWINDGHF